MHHRRLQDRWWSRTHGGSDDQQGGRAPTYPMKLPRLGRSWQSHQRQAIREHRGSSARWDDRSGCNAFRKKRLGPGSQTTRRKRAGKEVVVPFLQLNIGRLRHLSDESYNVTGLPWPVAASLPWNTSLISVLFPTPVRPAIRMLNLPTFRVASSTALLIIARMSCGTPSVSMALFVIPFPHILSSICCGSQ